MSTQTIAAPAAPATTNTPAVANTRHGKGIISRIGVESNDNGRRFVISIRVPAKLDATAKRGELSRLHREIEALVKTQTSLPEGQQPDANVASRIVELQKQLAEGQTAITTLVDTPEKYEYFSTPLSSPDSVRINTQQLRNAFPELMSVASDEKVFLTMLTQRSRFENREVAFTVSDQIDPATKLPKRGPKGQVYTNVRLEASMENLSEADALKLLGSGTMANTHQTAEASERMPGDPAGKDDGLAGDLAQ